MTVKNKKLIIFLIILLSVVSVFLIWFMIYIINGNFQLSRFNFWHKVSNELVFDKIYDNTFSKVYVKSDASDIYFKLSDNNNVRVVVYGEKENTSVVTTNDELSIITNEKSCIGFCFNSTIAKVEVYLPNNYDKKIEIVNNYGDIQIGDFFNSLIDINEECGDVEVIGGKEVIINNNYGNIYISKASVAKIKESAGNVKIDNVDYVEVTNNYGDIKIEKINHYLDLNNDCGDIKLGSINLSENSTIKNNLGDIKIGDTNEIYIIASTDLGKVKINNNYNKAEVTLKIENDCGDIKVDN